MAGKALDKGSGEAGWWGRWRGRAALLGALGVLGVTASAGLGRFGGDDFTRELIGDAARGEKMRLVALRVSGEDERGRRYAVTAQSAWRLGVGGVGEFVLEGVGGRGEFLGREGTLEAPSGRVGVDEAVFEEGVLLTRESDGLWVRARSARLDLDTGNVEASDVEMGGGGLWVRADVLESGGYKARLAGDVRARFGVLPQSQ